MNIIPLNNQLFSVKCNKYQLVLLADESLSPKPNTRVPTKTSRVRLSAQQKLALYSYHTQHLDISLRALATWAGSTFKLKKPSLASDCASAAISSSYRNDARSNPTRETTHRVHCLLPEKTLVRWIERYEHLKMPIVTWETIRAKSERIRIILVQDTKHASNSKLLNIMFLDGWIQKLQERQILKPRRIHGEAWSASAVDF